MWCDWSNSTALSRQARCSSRQLVYSLGTTGYTYAPIFELRNIWTGLPAAFNTLSRFCWLIAPPLEKSSGLEKTDPVGCSEAGRNQGIGMERRCDRDVVRNVSTGVQEFCTQRAIREFRPTPQRALLSTCRQPPATRFARYRLSAGQMADAALGRSGSEDFGALPHMSVGRAAQSAC